MCINVNCTSQTLLYLNVSDWPGLILILLFSLNAAYIGSRLGICWELLEHKHEEFSDAHVRDPYPLIAEKAGHEKGVLTSKILRVVAVGMCNAIT